MKLKPTEHNYERLADKYHFDVYENNNEFTLFNQETGNIIINHAPDMDTIIKETVNIYNNYTEKARQANNIINMFKKAV